MSTGTPPAGPVPVLMYHDVEDSQSISAGGHSPYVVSAAAFRAQMQLLAKSGFSATSLENVLNGMGVCEGRRGRSCVITFDDGHESNCTRALPALLDIGFRATFFVTVGWIGRAPYMTWEQLRSLVASGMEIGSHSMTHRPPASLGQAELFAEMADSKKLLEDRLGQPILTASSPTGFFNPKIIRATLEAGYRALCIGRIAVWTSSGDRFRIPRLPVKQSTSLGDFDRMVHGESHIVARLRRQQIIRNGLKGVLGVEGYLLLRRALMSLKSFWQQMP